MDRALRANDQLTGNVVAELALPAYPTGASLPCLLGGRQYVAAATTPETPAEIIALMPRR